MSQMALQTHLLLGLRDPSQIFCLFCAQSNREREGENYRVGELQEEVVWRESEQ